MHEPRANIGNYEHGLTGDMLSTWRAIFQRQRAFAENAIDQLDDAAFFATPASGLNSVAIIVKHIAGNLRSRWTDFLTSDGEKPDRDRDSEFVPPEPSAQSRRELMDQWDAGWGSLFTTLDSLSPEDMGRTVYIRTQPHSVHGAIIRSLDHISGHVGQIQILARWHVGEVRWKWFTIAPGGTKAFNAQLRKGNQAS